jgi:5-methylcytosine-specific restriction endonuclease McrA
LVEISFPRRGCVILCLKRTLLAHISSSISGLARQLVERLSSRLANETRELVLFLIELAEFDSKKVALELGYPSTLGCLVGELGLTESSAPNQVLLATAPAATVAADRVATSPSSEPPPAAPAEELEAVTLWVGRSFREELAVRTLLSHAVPSGKKEDVLLHVLRAQRKVLEHRRHGSPKRKTVLNAAVRGSEPVPTDPADASNPAVNREAVPPPPSDASDAATHASREHISAASRRQVFDREGGSCAYVGEEGRRCGSTLRLEYQHIIPVARGGRSTADNLTLFCRAHNQLQAEKDFGAEHVTQKRAVSALTNLGYKRAQAEQAVNHLPPTTDLSALVRDCLRLLGK